MGTRESWSGLLMCIYIYVYFVEFWFLYGRYKEPLWPVFFVVFFVKFFQCRFTALSGAAQTA